MRGRFVLGLLAAAVFASTLASADKKQKPKPAVVEIQSLKFSIDGKTVNLDGSIHNSGERTIEKLVLPFHFFDTEHKPVSSLKLVDEDETIEPGDDAAIHPGPYAFE